MNDIIQDFDKCNESFTRRCNLSIYTEEGILDTLKEIVRKIKEGLIKLWEKFKEIFNIDRKTTESEKKKMNNDQFNDYKQNSSSASESTIEI